MYFLVATQKLHQPCLDLIMLFCELSFFFVFFSFVRLCGILNTKKKKKKKLAQWKYISRCKILLTGTSLSISGLKQFELNSWLPWDIVRYPVWSKLGSSFTFPLLIKSEMVEKESFYELFWANRGELTCQLCK